MASLGLVGHIFIRQAQRRILPASTTPEHDAYHAKEADLGIVTRLSPTERALMQPYNSAE